MYLFIFALGNACGPILLGHLFDTVGRKPMIAGTYALSGVLLAITGWMFNAGMLTATTQTVAWTIIFFVASSAASSAYLTVSEIFPLEIRALAIALFYAVGTLVGGVGAPALFGCADETGNRARGCSAATCSASALMVGAAGVELLDRGQGRGAIARRHRRAAGLARELLSQPCHASVCRVISDAMFTAL